MKNPPHSYEAEISVLGSILVDPDSHTKVGDIIHREDFYDPKNQVIYEAMNQLINKNAKVDLITLSNHLSGQKLTEKCGGPSYLAELIERVPTSAHIVQYALIVKHKSTLRKLLKAGQDITALSYEEDKDVEALLEKAEKQLFSVSQNFVKDKFVHIKDILTATYDKIIDLHDPEMKDKFTGVPSGFKSLDNITNGFHSSDLIILAARPSMGKTALALNMAQNAAKKGHSIGVISLEMAKDQLVERMFSSLLEVDSWKIKSGKLEEADFARIGPVMDQMNSLKIYIDDSLGSSVTELRAKTRRLQMEHGLDMLIIDYLQLMSSNKGGASFNRVQEIAEISRSLKSLARELNIPIIALSQLSRAVESRPNKQPVLSDLRDSGAIEQDADIVLMLYRDDYYDSDSDRKGLVDVFIRKHRNGPVGQIEMKFKKERMRFYDLDKKRPEQGQAAQNRTHKEVGQAKTESFAGAETFIPDF